MFCFSSKTASFFHQLQRVQRHRFQRQRVQRHRVQRQHVQRNRFSTTKSSSMNSFSPISKRIYPTHWVGLRGYRARFISIDDMLEHDGAVSYAAHGLKTKTDKSFSWTIRLFVSSTLSLHGCSSHLLIKRHFCRASSSFSLR